MRPYELVFGRQPVMAIDLEVPVYINLANTIIEQIRVLKRTLSIWRKLLSEEMKEKCNK